jgi:hypothetical protein
MISPPNVYISADAKGGAWSPPASENRVIGKVEGRGRIGIGFRIAPVRRATRKLESEIGPEKRGSQLRFQ